MCNNLLQRRRLLDHFTNHIIENSAVFEVGNVHFGIKA